jgi:hypothetical protein
MPDAGGDAVPRGLLFISAADGSAMRQVTTLSAKAQSDYGGLYHWDPMWSPDARYIGFTVSFPSDPLGAVHDGCEPVIVLPVDAANVPIDSVTDPDSEHFMITDPHTGQQAAMTSCYVHLAWLGAP